MKPLVLHDGTRINTETGEVIVDEPLSRENKSDVIAVPTHSDAVDAVMRTKRALVDLPDLPANMHPVAATVAYEMFGLSVQDIAIALDSSVAAIETIRSSSAYGAFKLAATQNLIEAHDDVIRGALKQHAGRAVNRVVRALDADNDAVALTAARDLLDRSGYAPKQIVDHQHSMMNEMRIVHVDRQTAVPDHARLTINVTPDKE